MLKALLASAFLPLLAGVPWASAAASDQPCARAKGENRCGPSSDGTSTAPPLVKGSARDFGAQGTLGLGNVSNVHAKRLFVGVMLRDGGASIHDVTVDEARAFVIPDQAKPLTIDNVTIERVAAKVTKRGIYIRGNSSGWRISDARIEYIGPKTAPGDIPEGIQINGTAHDILIERVEMSGFVNTEPPKYPNADGMSCERGNDRITVRLSSFHDNTDGGFDCKATNVVLDRVTSARNGRNFRLWGKGGTATTITSIDPREAHIWIGAGADYTIDRLVARGGGFLVDVGDPTATLTIKSCDLSGFTGTELVHGEGKVTLGPSCKR